MIQYSNRSLMFLVLSTSVTPVLGGCDTSEGAGLDLRPIATEAEQERLRAEFDWEAVPPPAAVGGSSSMLEAPAPASVPALEPCNIETFHFSASEFIALSMAPGGLFALQPSGIPALPPELAEGFLLGFTFYDEQEQVVGFGTEQEVLDFEQATGQTTYTLTIPDRGTLMLRQEEEFAYLLEEVADMVASEELIRTYNPPLVNVHTVPGSGWIVGGTGEFDFAFGLMREYSIVRQLDLTTGQHDLGIILQVAIF